MPISRLNSGRSPRFCILGAGLVTGVLLAGVLSFAAKEDYPHAFQSVGCTHCHIMVPGQSTLITKKVFRRDINELCLECHEDSASNRVNHRVGIAPSMKVPDDLHLDEAGRLTCITCHMPHLPHVDKRTGGRTYFLRRSLLKRELCLACHYEEKFEEPVTTLRIVAPIDNSIIKDLPVPLIGMTSDDLIDEVFLVVEGSRIRLPVANRVFSTLLSLSEGISELKIEAPRAKPVHMSLLFSPNLSADVTYKLYYSHGILKKSDCKLCHPGDSDPTVRDPDKVLCGKCHEGKNTLTYLHGPVAAGSCTVCHDPHGQTNPRFLVEEGERLCLTCHTEKEVLLHFIDKSAGGLEQLREKGCSFCHDPHQSDKKYLLRKK